MLENILVIITPVFIHGVQLKQLNQIQFYKNIWKKLFVI